MNTDKLKALVSVVIPAYNCEKYIKTALSSVMAQTVENIEIIVIDDCSTDNTWKVIEQLAEKDSRIRAIKNEKNLGVAETRNKAMQYSQGEFIALLDSDDYWYEGKLEKQIKLQKETGADLIYCSYAIVDEEEKKKCSNYIVPDHATLDMILKENVIGCSTVLFKSDIGKKYCFQKKYYHEDFVFWIDVLKGGAVARGVKEVLSAYRVRENSRASNKWKSTVNRYKVIRGYLRCSILKSSWMILRFALKGIVKYGSKR